MRRPLPPQVQPAVAAVEAALGDCAGAVDAALPDCLPAVSPHAGDLGRALTYSLSAGKRVRPLVVMQAAAACGLAPEEVLPAACAFELLHTATLIHDDLPCIDDSDLRRGRPSSHVAFDEATALLAGDALLLAACETLARQAERPATPPDRVVRALVEFTSAAGAAGLIGGEMADILGEQHPPDADLLAYIHLHKTARLFSAAARCGAILAGAGEPQVAFFGQYAEYLGMLFQVTDDLLDALGEEDTLGKPAGADAAAGKQTYPALLGLEGAQAYADELLDQVLALAEQLPAGREIWTGLPWLVRTRSS